MCQNQAGYKPGKPSLAELKGLSSAVDQTMTPATKSHTLTSPQENITLLLPTWVNGSSVDMVIDSGSTITVVSSRIFDKIYPLDKPTIEPTNETIVVADGRYIPVKGRAIVTLGFGPLEFSHSVLIADLQADGLLGNDFLKPHGCNIDHRHECVRIEQVSIYYREVGDTLMMTCRVEVAQTVTIAPGEQAILPANVIKRGKHCPQGLIQASDRFVEKTGLMIGKSLVTNSGNNVPMRVLNLTDETKTIYKGTHAGLYHPVREVVNDPELPTHRVATVKGPFTDRGNCTLPDHLEQLLNRSIEHLSPAQLTIMKCMLFEYQDIFAKDDNDLGCTDQALHTIDTGDSRPIKQAPRRLPIHQKREVEAHVTDMLERGIIEKSHSPWASAVVLVKKKDGSTRYCVDYRKVNEVTKKDAYPLPRIEESLDALSGSNWFSTLDLCSGYWQVQVDPKDRPKTAFTTSCGLFQFTVMPFGLCNAPSTFERLMEMVLHGLHWDTCLIYLDDLIIHATSFEEEVSRLRSVFDRLRSAGLKLKGKKCNLFQKEVVYLGHLVSEHGVHTYPQKIEAVEKWPTPKCARDVRSFVGLCSYYRKFNKGFAQIARPLHKLTELGQKFHWNEACDEAFHTLKKSLISAPILAYPQETGLYVLDTDACDTGIGGVLSQVHNGVECVIAYASRSLSKCERRYCVTRKELLAIVHFVKYFKHYLYGCKFLVRTDHGALRWLFNFKSPEGQVAGWIQLLSTYDFEIEHRPGKQHGNADALSRSPCHQCGHGVDSDNSDLLYSEDYKQKAKEIVHGEYKPKKERYTAFVL